MKFKKINNLEKFKHFVNETWEVQGIIAVPVFIHAGPVSGIFSMKNVLGYNYSKFIMQYENDYIFNYRQILVLWDASDFASGIYYYMIKAGDFRQVKKMLLVR